MRGSFFHWEDDAVFQKVKSFFSKYLLRKLMGHLVVNAGLIIDVVGAEETAEILGQVETTAKHLESLGYREAATHLREAAVRGMAGNPELLILDLGAADRGDSAVAMPQGHPGPCLPRPAMEAGSALPGKRPRGRPRKQAVADPFPPDQPSMQ
jgi:hypothetical protein